MGNRRRVRATIACRSGDEHPCVGCEQKGNLNRITKTGATTTDGKVKRFSAKKVSATDTTGAGDCFIGAFAAAIAAGANEERAVQFGIDCATKSVTRKGAQSSYPRAAEISTLS